nr:MAG TPA: hypothetical protein [Crassvirales sp.]
MFPSFLNKIIPALDFTPSGYSLFFFEYHYHISFVYWRFTPRTFYPQPFLNYIGRSQYLIK